ncbi:hypothetical protein J2S11_000075 [Bacillus horti]|uniref:Enoyl-CoA hydratase n=2 Tax=Caldalkalibacillus horti TaxID=77523 RepID=A0ABT9VT63_9BACI|nr:hypothetical protein [Bacillus horti]
MGKKRALGQYVDQIQVGDSFHTESNIEDKDILIYLGLSDDANPVYIQHNYAVQTAYQKPIVPHVMLVGIVYSSINKHIPGPGSVVLSSQFEFPEVLYHYAKIDTHLDVIALHPKQNEVTFSVLIKDEQSRTVLRGKVKVAPPLPLKPLHENAFENF